MRKLVLWGHHIDEYQEMFDLSPTDLSSKILEYGSGASAINFEENQKNNNSIISCDPLFVLDKATLRTKVALIFDDMLNRFKKNEEKFNFSKYGGFDAFVNYRRAGVETFFNDYVQGKNEGRYIGIVDHKLPLPDFSFDFALSSHYLFSDLEGQDVDFHLAAIRELARIAKEVRIFPLIDRDGELSPMLGPVLLGLHQEEFGVEVRNIPYALQDKGNAMLRVWAQKCHLS